MFISIIKNEKDQLLVERLYMKYKSVMYYTAFNILHDKYLAEDAIHQSFIKVINNLDKIDEENCHRTMSFLVIICRNTCYDIYKKKTDLTHEDAIWEIADTSEEPSAIVINEENIKQVISKICKMKKIYQDVILLKYSQNYSNEEIAKLLSISCDLVRKRIERGKRNLSDLLKKEGLK